MESIKCEKNTGGSGTWLLIEAAEVAIAEAAASVC